MIIKIYRLILIAVICGTIASWVHAQPLSSREHLIKAAFLYNFAKFVDWSPESLPESNTSLILCVLGQDSFGGALESLEGKTVKGRELVVRHTTRLENLDKCHILFISASEKKRLPEILKSISKMNLLTVSDMKGFAQEGGIINLVKEGSRIRFEINLDAASLSGLIISSNLLKLAKIVRSQDRKTRK